MSPFGPRDGLLAPGVAARRRRFRSALWISGLLLGAAALLEPAWGENPDAREPGGADIVIGLDVSRSMLARDADPDRLGRAKREIAGLAAAAKGDRIALVAFAGEARLLVPLTADLATLVEIASAADPLAVERGGTDLGAALDAARAALDAGSGDRGCVVILTDGEDLGGRGRRAAETCGARGIPVHCMGIGSSRGSKIPVPGRSGEEYLKDRAGREVISALDPASLESLAAAGGGEYVESSLADLYRRRILPDSRNALARADRRNLEPRFQWPLAAAFLLWILAWCPPPVRS